ncbi:MAG TPA: hypothetical protein VE961_24320 [Pyrinomonadaceae bacterium]|nr:hypothetical protein [Pyrinomonadaceae bacterium]
MSRRKLQRLSWVIGSAFAIACGVYLTEAQTPAASGYEYLWCEAENMRGITQTAQHEPQLNPSYLELPAAKVPGWSISGPGVSAEWSQGGESEWNSVAASADETRAAITQTIEIPRGGQYRLWVRYADWANKSENFVVRVSQTGITDAPGVSFRIASKQILEHEFGVADLVDPHNEMSIYWGWSFAWDSAPLTLARGPAQVSIEITKPAEARRQVDCFLITNDLSFVPEGRRKPDFAATRYLREWSLKRPAVTPLIDSTPNGAPQLTRPKVGGRDFLMPWNVAKEFWQLYDKPARERSLYPFNAEPVDEYLRSYAGKREVPIFSSKLIVPVVYISDLPDLLKDGSPFRRYLAATKAPFAVLINYGAANFASEAEAQKAWQLLNGELHDQFLGWISGESIGFVWGEAPKYLQIDPSMTRNQLLTAERGFYGDALGRKWGATFKTQTGPMWDKLLPAQSTSSTSFAHALAEWGVRFLGLETAAVQPMTAMRLAFTRGAARQFGGEFFYYHAPNFGDTATTFTKQQNFAGPDNFFHSRYGATMGPSLSWYRKSYYLYYMSGASAIYLEQGSDQFFKPGPGEHPFQLNPLGRITDEFVRFAEKHPDRGEPYTPIAFLLDPAHGWDMTDYPQWPFGVSPIDRSDRALRELFGAAYYPGLVREGEPASGERQAFVPGIFGNIFDVLVASDTHQRAIDSYRAVIVGGRIGWSDAWIRKLTDYVRGGGTVVLNANQIKRLPAGFLGVEVTDDEAIEADRAQCQAPNERDQDLRGQMFFYRPVRLKGADTLMSADGRPLVTVNRVGRGKVVFVAAPDYLGEDDRLLPFVAHLLVHLAADATPVHVEGQVEYLINRNARGWVVTLFNDNGVFKPQQGLAEVDRSASVNVSLALRGAVIQSANEWIADRKIEIESRNGSPGAANLTIAPGGIAVVELVTSR